MTTLRVTKNKDNPYATFNRTGISDERLSFGARGLLMWLLDKPDDWTVRVDYIVSQNPKGRDHVLNLLRELTDAGYSHLRKWQNDLGQWQSERTIYESPSLNPYYGDNPSPSPDQPTPGKPEVGKPGVILNTDQQLLKRETTTTSINTIDVPDTGTLATDGKQSPTGFGDSRSTIFLLYEGNIGMIGAMMAEKLKQAEIDYPSGWIEEAFEIAVSKNARNWSYISAILRRWKTDGKTGKPIYGKPITSNNGYATYDIKTELIQL